jgi:hypothetical protein
VPESQFKAPLLKDLRLSDSEEIFGFISRHWRFKLWELPLNENDLPLNGADENRAARSMQQLVNLYARKMLKSNATIWVDHTPHNVRQARLLVRSFPGCKFIHIVRDGRAVAASVMPLDWGPNSIVEAAHFWVEQTAYGLAAEQTFGIEKVCRVHYEDLVRDPEKSMRRLAEFLDLEFTPQMVEGGGFVAPRYTAHQHVLITHRPDCSRIDAWKTRLTPREHEIFEHLTEDFLDYMGYQRECAYPTRGLSASEALTAKTRGFLRKQIANRIRAIARRAGRARVILSAFLSFISPSVMDAVTTVDLFC